MRQQLLTPILCAFLSPLIAQADNNAQGNSGDHAPPPSQQERGRNAEAAPMPSPTSPSALAQAYSWQMTAPQSPWDQSGPYGGGGGWNYGNPWDNPWNSPLQMQPPSYNYNITIPNTPAQTWHHEPPYSEQAAKQAAFDALVRQVAKEARHQRGEAGTAPSGIHSSIVDAPAFSLKPRPNDFALVVGIENYPQPLPAALFARRDAEAVRANLVALGWPQQNVISLIDNQATLARISAYVEDWLPKNASTDSRIFFYFAGHGAPSISGDAYLVPWDGSPNFLNRTAFPLQRLYSHLAKIKAAEVTAALDSCFSGAGSRSVLPQGARPLIVNVATPILPKGPAVVFTATGARGISGSLPEQGHGIFTYYFLRGLESAVSDKMPSVKAEWLYGYLGPRVKKAAALQNLDQSPRLEGNISKTVATLR